MKYETSISQAEIEQLKAAWGTLCLVIERMRSEAEENDAFVSGPLAWTDDAVKTAAESLCSLWQELEEKLRKESA